MLHCDVEVHNLRLNDTQYAIILCVVTSLT